MEISKPNKIGIKNGVILPANHPLLNLEKKVGKFSYLLTKKLISNQAYWQKIVSLVGERNLEDIKGNRSLIPVWMLPLFKRMVEIPFDLLVSIPRAGDPLAFALLRMAKISEKIGISLSRMPTQESFGQSGMDFDVIHRGFFSELDLEKTFAKEIKEKVLKMASKKDESFQNALDTNLGAVINFFSRYEYHRVDKIFTREKAVEILRELVKGTSLVQTFKEAKNILIVDDVTQDLIAINSVRYPLSILAPQANLEIGLFCGGPSDEKDLSFHRVTYGAGHWGIMHKGEWAGLGEEIGYFIMKLLLENLKIEKKGKIFEPDTYSFQVKAVKITREKSELIAFLSFLTQGILYEKGLLFSAGTSWRRKWEQERWEEKLGKDTVETVRGFLQEKIEDSNFLVQLTDSSSSLKKITLGRLEIEKGIQKLFENNLNQKLLKFYLQSQRTWKELQPIYHLLILMNY